ncbi:MAG: SHOCT domain-containing protein, partial [Chloroflexi bacterium]|nr:SHOCT domain-containing protein [Chloroflexota bacterium]
LIVVVVAGLIAWAVVRLGLSRTEPADEGDSPIAVLQMRLARGEITATQFEERHESILGSR